MLPGDYDHEVKTVHRKRIIKRIVLEVLVAVLLIVPAIVLCFYFHKKLVGHMLKQVELKPDTPAYANWLNPPVTSTRSYHLFNITNPVDFVLNPSSETSLNLTETRAYPYSLVVNKENIQWSNDNKTVSYSVRRTFTRHPDKFDRSLVDDTGNFINMLRATFRTQFQNKAAQTFFDIGGNDVFYNRNAVEQLEGFTSDLFTTMRDKMIGPNTEKSGFVYRYNGSLSYNYTIKAGLEEKGQVLAFATEYGPYNIASPTQYKFPIYDGLTFVPMLFDKQTVHIFQPDACRPIRIKFNRVVKKFGITAHEYTVKLIDFDNCGNANDLNTCPVVEQLDVSKCVSDSLPNGTIYLSKPHFYGANKETLQEINIQGFDPSPDKHESFIYFEPYTGTPLHALHRIQMNIHTMVDPMRVSSEDETSLVWAKRKGVRRVLPLMWIDQEVNLSTATISRLRTGLLVLRYGPWVIMLLAIGLAAAFIVVMELLAKRANKKEQRSGGGYVKAEALFGRSKK